MAHRGLVRSSPRFLYSISVFSYATQVNFCEEFRVHKQRRHRVVRGVLYPRGVGSPTTRPDLYRSWLCLASIFSKCTRSLETEYFRKNVGDFWGRSGVPPVVAPEGGVALPRVKPGVPQCSCASGPSKVRKVPKNKQVMRTSLLFREIENASTNDVQIARNSRDRSNVAAVCSKRW